MSGDGRGGLTNLEKLLMLARKAADIFYTILLTLVLAGMKVYRRTLGLKTAKKSVAGDVLVITGGGSGIGRLVALKMADLGAVVVSLDVNEAENNRTVEMIRSAGKSAHGFKCDLMNRQEVYAVCRRVQETVGDVSILINNAGIVSGAKFLDLDDDKIEASFRVNTISQFWTIKSFLPRMIENRKGHIVSMSSVAAFAGIPKLADYCASKSALLPMLETLTSELTAAGLDRCIHTTVVCPYMIDTGMFRGASSELVAPLKAASVADEIVLAILLNEDFLVLPRWLWLLCIFKTMMPLKGLIFLGNTLGFNSLMKGFIGRHRGSEGSADARAKAS